MNRSIQKKTKRRRALLVTTALLGSWLVFAQTGMRMTMTDSKAIAKFKKLGITLQTFTTSVDGKQLHYVATGNETGPVVVFIHGSPGSWTAFEDYLADSLLQQNFYLVSIDRPGFGKSDFGHALHLQEQVSLIGKLLSVIKKERLLYLVGHSLGGPVVAALAAADTQTINGILILAGSLDPAEEKPEKWRPVLQYTPLRYLLPGALAPSNKELWYLKKDLPLLQPQLSKIVCPVFIMHGKKDNLVPFGNMDWTEKQLVRTTVNKTVFETSGHFIPWEHFPEVKEKVMAMAGYKKD